MKTLKDYILTEKLKLNVKSKAIEHKYHPENKEELRSIIEELLKERGKDADLNDIDVSKIDNMGPSWGNGLFEKLDPHNIDISSWNVSNVKTMRCMFYNCENFNSDLSHWDISNVEDIGYMFKGCKKFNSDLSKWDVKKVEDMNMTFYRCSSLKNKPKWYYKK